MKWPGRCTSVGFDEACTEYDRSDIERIDQEPLMLTTGRIYVSPLSRTWCTAQSLFPTESFTEWKEIAEVPLRSYVDTDRTYPLWIWNIMGRLQWLMNSRRQSESHIETVRRANAVIDRLEAQAVDCTLVTHGFFLKTLLKQLKKRGYILTGDNHLRVQNLQMITAQKNNQRRTHEKNSDNK